MRDYIDRKLSKQISAVLSSGSDNFLDLVAVAKLDPKTAFIGADLRGIDLRNLDLSDFNFQGANLDGANLDGTAFAPGYSPLEVRLPLQGMLFPNDESPFAVYLDRILSQKRAYHRVAELIAVLCETENKALILDVVGATMGSERSILVFKTCKAIQELVPNHGRGIYVPGTIKAAMKSTFYMDKRRLKIAISERCSEYELVQTYFLYRKY